jgi:DNA invertase Pin-like site-specific DNA recombinase
MISKRTKEALAAAKRRGKTLGGHRGVVPSKAARKRGAESNSKRADARATDLQPAIESARAAGAESLRAIARYLNEQGIPTARGGEWSAVQVARVMERTCQ